MFTRYGCASAQVYGYGSLRKVEDGKSKSSCSMAKYLTHLFLQLESNHRFTFQQAVVVVVDRSLESEILHGLYGNEKCVIAASLSCSLFRYLTR